MHGNKTENVAQARIAPFELWLQIAKYANYIYACIEQASVWVKGLNDFYLLRLPNKSSFMVEVIQCIAEIKLWLHSQMEYFLFKVLSIYARCCCCSQMVDVWNCMKKNYCSNLRTTSHISHYCKLVHCLCEWSFHFCGDSIFISFSSHSMRWIQIVCHTTSMCRLLTMSPTVKHFGVSSSKYFNVTLSPCLYVLCSLFVHFSLLDAFFPCEIELPLQFMWFYRYQNIMFTISLNSLYALLCALLSSLIVTNNLLVCADDCKAEKEGWESKREHKKLLFKLHNNNWNNPFILLWWFVLCQ